MWDLKRPTYALVGHDDDASADIESKLQPHDSECVGLTSGIALRTKPHFVRNWLRYTVLSALLLCLVVLGAGMAYTSSRERYPPCVSPEKRIEWREMNRTEQQDYIAAVKCLQSFPAKLYPVGRLSDDFPWVHRHVARDIHNSALFLPYHRYFIHLYHKTLREHCRYHGTIPYWDWSRDWQDPSKSPIWDPVTGFGGDGDPNGTVTIMWGSCIKEGPFVDYEVLWSDFYPRPHCLSRGFGRQPGAPWDNEFFKPHSMADLMSRDTFYDFTETLEGGSHDAVPNGINGDFYTLESPNDPVFFLHHTNIDRLWWTWQRAKPGRMYEYNGPKTSWILNKGKLDDVMGMMGLGKDLRVRDVMDTENGMMCYGY
ncbi:putative tyrosinase [Lasiosphaeria hispida]|uniref:Tyrosinase n=1 Tax=Lasiosphaeria hispida TaxID=260671 RepID=A0AAJ0HSA6_9PEZI|nr:putative tyrosinase [Lasiosphaeria hispida]